MKLGWIRRFGVMVVCLLPTAPASGQGGAAAAKKKYDAYVLRVKAGDLAIDWRDFRLAAKVGGVNGDFVPREARDLANAKLRAGDNAAALAEAQKMIDRNMAWAEGHLLAMQADEKLHKAEDAGKQLAIAVDLLKSIMGPGDGKSPEQAWFVVDVAEEYFVIREVLGFTTKEQGLVNKGGHAYDRMTVTDDKGAESVIWFNTDTDMQALSQSLGSK